ncbi:alanine racemase [Tistrella bauzanensis]|uniref:Alanine racemase n=1 Tax=Tistrella bauzanensis TaxID=657419 RepID=A0ABQ1IHT5_9PROT|nr:alanine racemase [Tistrella bauzanensis]GGB39913.1 alanine racemase [Tistrella bauzanensis]
MNGLSPDLQTPCLVVDEARMAANITRMNTRIAELGVGLRPHLKTAKSIDIARRMLPDPGGPATVSTLREAEVFAAAGVRDILYAVGIAPAKLHRVQSLRAAGCDLAVVLDSVEQARAVAAASASAPIPALIEIDCDGKRAGLAPDAPQLPEIGRILHESRAELRGVMTHAGGSYDVSGTDAHAAFAERERLAVVTAAERLRRAGLPCPVVSVGSTPTALAARDLTGVTEVRAGVYVFFDLVMAGIGVCAVEDIALSVATTVIGHHHDQGWIMVDAGWMALSRERGTASHAVDQGHGLVCDSTGRVIPHLIVTAANQEHGILALRAGATGPLSDMLVGTVLRILPNHACATAAQFDACHVVPAEAGAAPVIWPRFGGW